MKESMKIGSLVKVSLDLSTPLFIKQAGQDFILFDNEHGNIDKKKLEELIMMTNAIGLDSIVRVDVANKKEISHALDCGAKGVLIPMVESVKQAQEAVRWAKYPPYGSRSYAGGAHTQFAKDKTHAQWITKKNQETNVCIQIESRQGVQALEDICKVEGVDVIFIGPADLAISYELPGMFEHPKLQQVIKQIVHTARTYKKHLGFIGSQSLLDACINDVTYLVYGVDSSILQNGFVRCVEEVESRKNHE